MKRATKATLDLSKAFGRDAVRTAQNVAKAATGYTTALTAYGVKVDETQGAQEKFNQALNQMEDNFEGTAETLGQTFNNQLTNVGNSFGDLVEAIGLGIVESEAINEIFNFVIDSLNALATSVEENKGGIKELAIVIAKGLGTAIGIVLKLIKTFVAQLLQIVAEIPAFFGGDRFAGIGKLGSDLETTINGIQSNLDGVIATIEALGKEGAKAGKTIVEKLGPGETQEPLEETAEVVESIGMSIESISNIINEDFIAQKFEDAGPPLKTLLDFLKDVPPELEKTNTIANDVANTLRGQAVNGALTFGDAIVDAFLTGEFSAKKFFKALLADLARAIIQALILRAILAALGGGSSGGTSSATSSAAFTGTSFAQHGGEVLGGLRGRDSVGALLQPGEIVLPTSLREDFSAISDLGKAIRSSGSLIGGNTQPTMQITNIFQNMPSEEFAVELIDQFNDLAERKGVRIVSSEVIS